MTTLAELKALAMAATPGPWRINTTGDEDIGIVRTIVTVQRGTEVAIATTGDVPDNIEAKNAAYFARLSPERILAMIACIEAADAMREEYRHREDYQDHSVFERYDTIRAALEE